jgi:hypothetical protein
MKKLFIFLTVATLAVNGVFAEKGDWALSGSATFDYSGPQLIDGKRNGASSLDFKFAPSLLYGISKHMYFGGELSADMRYDWNYQANEQVSNNYKNMFGIAPILRCYAFSGKRIGMFWDTKAGVYFGSDKAETSYTAIAANMTPGVELFINRRLSASISLNEMIGFGYEHAEPKGNTNSTDASYFRFVFNRTEINYAPLTFTFTYHIRKQQKSTVRILEIEEIEIVK